MWLEYRRPALFTVVRRDAPKVKLLPRHKYALGDHLFCFGVAGLGEHAAGADLVYSAGLLGFVLVLLSVCRCVPEALGRGGCFVAVLAARAGMVAGNRTLVVTHGAELVGRSRGTGQAGQAVRRPTPLAARVGAVGGRPGLVESRLGLGQRPVLRVGMVLGRDRVLAVLAAVGCPGRGRACRGAPDARRRLLRWHDVEERW
jgi:hypothetical protein